MSGADDQPQFSAQGDIAPPGGNGKARYLLGPEHGGAAAEKALLYSPLAMGRFIKRLLFQLLFPIFFGVFNQAAREGDKAAFPAEHGMGKFRKRIPREHAGGVITNGPQLHGVCGDRKNRSSCCVQKG